MFARFSARDFGVLSTQFRESPGWDERRLVDSGPFLRPMGKTGTLFFDLRGEKGAEKGGFSPHSIEGEGEKGAVLSKMGRKGEGENPQISSFSAASRPVFMFF